MKTNIIQTIWMIFITFLVIKNIIDIFILKNMKDNMYYPPEDKDKNIDKIIALLQQGEKNESN